MRQEQERTTEMQEVDVTALSSEVLRRAIASGKDNLEFATGARRRVWKEKPRIFCLNRPGEVEWI